MWHTCELRIGDGACELGTVPFLQKMPMFPLCKKCKKGTVPNSQAPSPIRSLWRYALGRMTVKVLPLPSVLSSVMTPFARSTAWRTSERPSPVPPISREWPLSTR